MKDYWAKIIDTMQTNVKNIRAITELIVLAEISRNPGLEVPLNDAQDFIRYLENEVEKAKQGYNEDNFSDVKEARNRYNMVMEELAGTFSDMIFIFRC